MKPTSWNKGIAKMPLREPTTTSAPKRKLRWYQFSLRTLLLLSLLVAVACSWFGVRLKWKKKEREAVAEIEKLRGSVNYDYQWHAPSGVAAQPPGPGWLRKLVGDDFFASVAAIHLDGPSMGGPTKEVTDADMAHLAHFTELEQALIEGQPRVTDAGVAHLVELTQLEVLSLIGPQVSDRGLKHLSGLTNLKSLSVSGSAGITDTGLVHLGELKQLEHLSLDRTRITDAGLVHLKALANLRSLSVRGTQVTNAGANRLRESLPKCQILVGTTEFMGLVPRRTQQLLPQDASSHPSNGE